MMTHTLFTTHKLTSLDDTKTFAINLAKITRVRDVICLEGPLGAGKTTFAKFFIESMVGAPIDVPSPTFTLVQTYVTPGGPLYHMDVYRLKNPDDIFELGYEEALVEGITLIEWSENIKEYLPHNRLHVKISLEETGERYITLDPRGNWIERMSNGL